MIDSNLIMWGLSWITTAGLAFYAHRLSRQSTKESAALTKRSQDLAESDRQADRIAELETYNRRMWAWARRMVDRYYRYTAAVQAAAHGGHPIPEAPELDPIPEPPDN